MATAPPVEGGGDSVSNRPSREEEYGDSEGTGDEFVLLEEEDDTRVSGGELVEGDDVIEGDDGVIDDEGPRTPVISEAELSEQENSSDSDLIPGSAAENHSDGDDDGDDADSEGTDSQSNTPPPRRSGRNRRPKGVFTYTEFGIPTVVRQ